MKGTNNHYMKETRQLLNILNTTYDTCEEFLENDTSIEAAYNVATRLSLEGENFLFLLNFQRTRQLTDNLDEAYEFHLRSIVNQ